MPESPVPAHEVLVNGSPLPKEAQSDLIDVTVSQDVAAPDMFALRLVNWDADAIDVTWSDAKVFRVGSEVEVRMGYVGALGSVMVGEITGLEPEFESSRVPMVTVRGHDRSHRLLRGKHTRTFAKMKDSDIAKKVASEAKLSIDAVDTRVKLDYVLQHNQTDMEFLQERAQRIGYEIAVEDKKLYFRPPRLTQAPAVTLARTNGLLEFYPRLTTMAQVSDVEVRGWDPKQKKEILGKASASRVTAKLGGRTVGPKAIDSAFGGATAGTIDRPVMSEAEASDIAAGILNQAALAYVVGEGATVGDPKLVAGCVLRIEGIGNTFSGDYYVASATHTFRPNSGYRTAFTVRRTAT